MDVSSGDDTGDNNLGDGQAEDDGNETDTRRDSRDALCCLEVDGELENSEVETTSNARK